MEINHVKLKMISSGEQIAEFWQFSPYQDNIILCYVVISLLYVKTG